MAALAEGWYIDGTALDEILTISTRDGWDDTPPLRGSDVTLLGRHGNAWRRKKYDVGVKTLTGSINGVINGWEIPETGTEQRALYEKNLDALLRLISPGNRLLSVERVYPDGARRMAACEVTSAITPQTLGNTAGTFSIQLGVPGAFWRDVDPQTYALPYHLSAADLQSVEVFSLAGQTAPCADAVISVTGPCTSITITDSVTGSGFTYGALDFGDTLTVDAGAFTATVGVDSVLTDLILFDGQLLEISPGPSVARGPLLNIAAPGKDTGFAVVVVSRRSWLR